MRAMQLLQLSENKHRRNLVHHFRKQTKDIQRNFRSNVKVRMTMMMMMIVTTTTMMMMMMMLVVMMTILRGA